MPSAKHEAAGLTAEKILVGSFYSIRTKTDTGRWDENSKALERTIVKELGKLAP